MAFRCSHLTYEAGYGKFRVSTRSQICFSYRKTPLRGGLRPSGRGFPPDRGPDAQRFSLTAAGCMRVGPVAPPNGVAPGRGSPLEAINRPD